MARFYIASKIKHAERWRALREEGHEIIASWIDQAYPDDETGWSKLASRCLYEASSAHCLILYVEEGEVLKGAFMEVGAALSHGVAVRVVRRGTPELGAILLPHPWVTEFESVEAALTTPL